MRHVIGDQTVRLKATIDYDRVWGGLLDYAKKCEIVNKYRQVTFSEFLKWHTQI